MLGCCVCICVIGCHSISTTQLPSTECALHNMHNMHNQRHTVVLLQRPVTPETPCTTDTRKRGAALTPLRPSLEPPAAC
eukprot:1159195-Pelagomonas_calceolata.AAC.6